MLHGKAHRVVTFPGNHRGHCRGTADLSSADYAAERVSVWGSATLGCGVIRRYRYSRQPISLPGRCDTILVFSPVWCDTRSCLAMALSFHLHYSRASSTARIVATAQSGYLSGIQSAGSTLTAITPVALARPPGASLRQNADWNPSRPGQGRRPSGARSPGEFHRHVGPV